MKRENLICFLLGMTVALLAVLVFRQDSGMRSLYAADSSNASSSNGLLAVGLGTGDESVLYIIDSVNQRIAYYKTDKNRKLTLYSARNTKYDLRTEGEVWDVNGMGVKAAKEAISKESSGKDKENR